MKTKKFDKKLVLNKETLTHLENTEMKVVKAGGFPWVDNQTTPELCP
jgi:hypothetical protein